MLGKIRVANAPWANHGWHATLRPNSAGLATLPTSVGDGRTFTLALDLCRHGIALHVSDGAQQFLAFECQCIADLHKGLVAMLDEHGLPSRFHGRPNEIPDAVRFDADHAPREYNRDSAARLHGALARIVPVFEQFRAGFRGKASPVHFFWGSFDLAVTRFSGNEAPEHPGGIPGLPDRITREAYSHEVSSAGFWPGGASAPPGIEPLFYSYAYPEPDGFRDLDTELELEGAIFDATLGEYVLSYAHVRSSPRPDRALLMFLQSSYNRAANLGDWNRMALEREPVAP
jgi:hypothetical protein